MSLLYVSVLRVCFGLSYCRMTRAFHLAPIARAALDAPAAIARE
ncbi:MAG TPA: hypothetical protein V6C88_03475 [Chroococcidiopsis sp.]